MKTVLYQQHSFQTHQQCSVYDSILVNTQHCSAVNICMQCIPNVMVVYNCVAM